MSDFRRVTDDFFVSPQISEEDIALAKEDGFVGLIVNHPDGEMLGQPSAETLEAVAKAAGMTFGRAPIAGPPSLHDIEAMDAALKTANGKTLAYCRSGTRSVTLWALVQAKNNTMSDDEIIGAAADAGYDLSGLKAGLESVRGL